MNNPWRQPAEESADLYPGLVVCDNRVSGSITVGRTRLPLWAFIGEVIRSGWEDAEKSYSITEYGMTPESLAEFLYNLLECRGEFGRLLLVLADAERSERRQRRPIPEPWWSRAKQRKKVAAQLRRCLAVVES